MQPGNLVPGDVVQIDPAHGLMWGGCFLLVEEVKSWGVQGFVPMPERADKPPGCAHLRVPWKHMELVGTAVFVPRPEAEGEGA